MHFKFLIQEDRSWFILLAVTLLLLFITAAKWMCDHPYAISWDEAEYFNVVLADQSILRDSGLRALRTHILYSDRIRPPAYRLLIIPFYSIAGFSPFIGRMVSFGFHWIGLAFLYLTTLRIADRKCPVLSVLICSLSPDVLFSSVLFYTEYPLFLATTGAFYFLVPSLVSKSDGPRNWIGLGLSLGLGLLAKSSFLLVATPVLGFALLAGRIRGLSGPPPSFAIKAGALGSLVAAPWWWINSSPALSFARSSRNFIYDSSGCHQLALGSRGCFRSRRACWDTG